MKKYLMLIACLIAFSACDDIEPVVTEPIATEPVVTEPVEVEPTVTVKTEVINNETDEFIIDVKYPQFEGKEEVNEMITTMMLAEIESFKAGVVEFEPIDIEEMKSGFYTDYIVYLNDAETLSIGFTNDIYYEGSAHGNSFTTVFNFDYTKNEKIEMYTLFNPDTNWIMALSEMIVPRLKEQLYEDEFVEDDWIEDGAGDDPANFENFNITESSIIVHFDPYEVAAYAAGPQQVELMFSDLYALLAPKWAGKVK